MASKRERAIGELRSQILGDHAKAMLIIASVADGRNPHAITTIDDPELLRIVSLAAIRIAEEEVAAAGDTGLAHVKRADLRRLRMALKLFVPGLEEDGVVN